MSRMKDELGEFEIRGNGVESGMQGKRKRRKMGREKDGRRWRGREKGTKDEKSDYRGQMEKVERREREEIGKIRRV